MPKSETLTAKKPPATPKASEEKNKEVKETKETKVSSLENTIAELEAQPEEAEEEEFSPVHLFLEDFAVTALLSAGKPLGNGDLAQRADNFKLPRQSLRPALKDSTRIAFDGQQWEANWRSSRHGQSREERSRQPVESMINELLHAVGKPLPVAVISREVSLMRNQYDPNMKVSVANVLKTARFALEVATDVWMHQDFVLSTGAPGEELMIRENKLQNDADFQGLIEFAEISAKDPAGIAKELMEFTGGPLSQKVIGFFCYRANPARFSTGAVAAALNDRKLFQPLIGGFVTLQSLLPDLRTQVEEFLSQFSGTQLTPAQIQDLIRQRVVASQVIAPRPEELERLKKIAQDGDGSPLELADVVLGILEIEPDDAKLVPTLQGLNEALRRDPLWIPAGMGRFILRENIPAHVGQIPDVLRPVTLDVLDPETKEPYDFEMDDEGLEGDAVTFVHSPFWEDVAEESEVNWEGRGDKTTTRLVVLNHHLQAGTLKLRRMDEELFDLSSGIARLSFKTGNNDPIITGWASRESGLIYGLGDWCEENLPPSGGALVIAREKGVFSVTVDTPDAATFITERRAEELETLRESARYLSLYEVLGRILGAHSAGMEMAAIWAEVNVVRRTSKRLLASVLSGYNGFHFKQRGQQQFLWLFEASRGEGGFKKNKRKFVRK